MAVDLSKLVFKRKIDFQELTGKSIAIDAYNVLYQFLSIIRGPDGAPLTDSHGNVTSHLSGLFYRSIELMGYGIKPIYVFDGIPSILKQRTIEARIRRRTEAHEAWQTAVAEGRMEEARSHAQASTRVTKEIVASAKALLDCMGIPHINAPSEGEAQATQMCKDGLVHVVASQDYDTMLFGAPYVVRNLTFSGRRKLPKKNIYINVEPELMDFKETLKALGINQQQLIWIGIMLGTDFNDGVPGIGPKTALKITKEAKSIEDIKRIALEKYKYTFELDPGDVEALFLHPEVKEITQQDYRELLGAKPDPARLVEFMCKEHDFSEERIAKFTEKLAETKNAAKQKGLGAWTD